MRSDRVMRKSVPVPWITTAGRRPAASKMTRMSASPGSHWPQSIRSVTTRRTWMAVISATSS
ncbi:hypothetical protein OHQ89_03030 [Streptomyces canus]|uniref:hypothetical protein n=1 Tax=Streptomyces canus TaxID=58343 RepID=UPI0030E52D80